MRGAKDTLPAEREPGVVYALECTDCTSVYIGKTKRTARRRTKEHKMYTHTGHVELSAVADHAHTEGYSIHWTPRVLAKEYNVTKRKTKEALATKQFAKSRGDRVIMNHDSEMNLSKLWLDVL